MGRVWLARDRLLDREVALKEPKGRPGGPAEHRLRREGEVLARLDHPGIVALLHLGRMGEGRPFVAMRLAVGDSLGSWSEGEHSLRRRLAVVRALVAAMAHAHAHGVVHRDLKPANVRVAADSTLCILDWGLARLTDAPAPSPVAPGLTRQGARVGTPAYMSPEQAAGEVVGPEADVWSLGVMAWEVLSGRRAYSGRAATEVLAGVLAGPPPALSSVAPQVPEAVAGVVDAALSPLRSGRPADAGELLLRLDAALEGEPARPRRRWGIAGLLLLAGLGLGWLLQPPPPPEPPPQLTSAEVALGLSEEDPTDLLARACSVLKTDPSHPVARGALVDPGPQVRRLWTVPTPGCSIGEHTRWDGRFLACASPERLSLVGMSKAGASVVWQREDEVHRVLFHGDDWLLVWPPEVDHALRLELSTGRNSAWRPTALGRHPMFQSRSERRLMVREDDKLRWIDLPAANSSRDTTERMQYGAVDGLGVHDVVVLTDGSLLRARDRRVELLDHPRHTPVEVWALPEGHGQARHLVMSASMDHVLVVTSTDEAAVLERSTGRWSRWRTVRGVLPYNLAVSPSGRRVAQSGAGVVRVWSADRPGASLALPGTWTGPRFLDEDTVVVNEASSLSAWSIDAGALKDRGLTEPVRGVVPFEGGWLAWGERTSQIWWTDGRVTELGAVADAAASQDGASIALARGEAGVTVVRQDGQVTDHPAPPCDFVAWPTGDRLVCVAELGGPAFLDAETGVVDRTLDLGRHAWVGVSAHGSHLVLMDWDTVLYSVGEHGLRKHGAWPWANVAKVTPDGRHVLLNSRQGVVRRQLSEAGDADGAHGVVVPTPFRPMTYAVSPDGSRVAAYALGPGLQVHRLDDGAPDLIYPHSVGAITALAWMPDGRGLLVGDEDGRVDVLSLTPEACP